MPDSKTVARKGGQRALLSVLSLSVFFVGASEFMLAAMLNPLGAAFGTDTAQTTWLISSYALAYAIAAPVLGHLSDRVDRRRLLLIALLSFSVDGLGIAFAPSFEAAVALRIFGGLASAVIIPNALALIADAMPRARHASAMGAVMLGMTLGIASGPAIAGLLTSWLGWRAPFILAAAGCLAAFAIGRIAIPRTRAPVGAARAQGLQWLRRWPIVRPMLAKGLWNGTAVGAFLLSGEVLRQRYRLDVAGVGLSAAAFGIGLGIGNLSAGWLRRLAASEERALVCTTALLATAIGAFHFLALPLPVALACLAAWGAALGAGAPLSTTVLAHRAHHDKGAVLAAAETLNNVSILVFVPPASALLANGNGYLAAGVLMGGVVMGVGLSVWDALKAGHGPAV